MQIIRVFVRVLLPWLFVAPAFCADLQITSVKPAGVVAWSNAFPSGVCTIETLGSFQAAPSSGWQIGQNFFTTNLLGQGSFPPAPSNEFLRLLAVDISADTPQGYTNLLRSYGRLHTIAGNGAGNLDGVNFWRPEFEGGYATNAALSRPHFAMADAAGNVFIVDKDSHSVLKVTPDGRIHTVAGTHVPGNGPDYPTNATRAALFQPNGLYVQADGSFFILDTGNGKVRRCDAKGMMSTLFSVPGGIGTGRGLWVDAEQTEVVFCDGTAVKAWDRTNGVTVLNTNFVDLGNLIATSKEKNVVVTDRGDDKVYKVDISGNGAGNRTLLFGHGHGDPVVEGTLATTNCLNGVRGVWRLPNGGYLFGLHEGNQVLYVDSANIVHVLVDGQSGAHSGDGEWFYAPGYKLGQVRSVTLDSAGNILIVEGDAGYVRQIDFHRLSP